MTDKGDAISRAALERSIRDYADRVGPVRGEYEFANGILKALTMVEQAPTIEPQVVRCGECRYFCADHPSGETCLDVCGMCEPDEDDYCNHFEPRMDAGEEST